MFTLEVFLMCLLVVSTVTGFATEAVKTILTEHNKTYKANTLAGVMAAIISIIVGVGYVLLMNSTFAVQSAMFILALTISGWLCAMVGYDKIIQAIEQFKK